MVISGIERSYVPTESHQSFRSNPMGHVCIVGNSFDNMGGKINFFEKYQPHCSSTEYINDLEMTNVRGSLIYNQSTEESSFTNKQKQN